MNYKLTLPAKDDTWANVIRNHLNGAQGHLVRARDGDQAAILALNGEIEMARTTLRLWADSLNLPITRPLSLVKDVGA